MLLEIKNRITTLNIIRLVIGISLLGEALHSQSVLFGIAGMVLLIQIFLNKKCTSANCEIEKE